MICRFCSASVQVFLELVALVAVVKELDGLFEADGDDAGRGRWWRCG